MNNCLSKIAPNDTEDLKQDVFYILLNKDFSLISSLHNQGTLSYYAVKVASNIYKKRYRNKITTTELIDVEDYPDNEINSENLIEEFKSMDNGLKYPYFTELIKAIATHGSQSKVSRATGIPVRSISQTVNVVRKYLKSKM